MDCGVPWDCKKSLDIFHKKSSFLTVIQSFFWHCVSSLWSFCRQFSTLSRRFHEALPTHLTVHVLCFDSIYTALNSLSKTQWHLEESYTISVQMPQMTTGFALWPLCVTTKLLLHCRRPYRQNRCGLIRTLGSGVCFEHDQSVHCSTRFHRVYWQCQCLAAVMFVIILCGTLHLAFSWMPKGCHEKPAPVWQEC